VDKKNIFITTSGVCWKRSLDSGKIKKYLLKNNYKVVESIEKADVFLVVTCAFLNGKSENSHAKIKAFLEKNDDIIVAGCLPTVEKEKLREYFSGKIIETKNISEDIEKIFPPKKICFKDVDDANILFDDKSGDSSVDFFKKAISKSKAIERVLSSVKNHVLQHLIGADSPAYKFSEKQFHVRIAWGCTGNCSYCTIKKSTGSFYSKPFDLCVKEFKKGLDEGYINFVLDATDLGAYGIDIGTSFIALLDKFTDFPGSYYINIRELNARWITRYTDDLVRILEKNKILLFDVAIQSASPRVLKLMNRPYDVEKLKNSLLKIRNVTADFSFTCEFIVGFPTETEEEFFQSLNFIREVGFDGGQLYEFSLRPGTEAVDIEPKIPEDVILKRINFAKKFLKKNGYYVKHLPNEHMLVFTKL
jgi:threonylcarbamoyladenosine tRNA methylthiotransferase CDKAL1